MLFTLYFVKHGYAIEINPLIRYVMQNEYILIIVKLILPLLLLTYTYMRLPKATMQQFKVSSYLIIGVVVLYIGVNALHLLTASTILISKLLVKL